MESRLSMEPGGGLRGTWNIPGDKSISHRAALFGALGSGDTVIRGFLPGQDCVATLRCLEGLGVQVERDETSAGLNLTIHGKGLFGLSKPSRPLDCSGSGTTMRLISGILSGQPFESTLTGNDSLRGRPMRRIIDPLARMGADISGSQGDTLPPLHIKPARIHGMVYHLPVASAQVKSAILLAGLYAQQPTVIHEPGPARDHTERMLTAMGATIEVQDNVIVLHPTPEGVRDLLPLDIAVPGDFSSAAFLIVAACILPGSKLRLENVGVNPTRMGLWDVLRRMGARIALENERVVGGEPVADIVAESSDLRGTVVGGDLVPRMIDEFPILAVAATQAMGTTIVRDAAELRVKETDRISAVARELTRLGAHVEEHPDGFLIRGGSTLYGHRVSSHGDHRLGMSLAIAGLAGRGKTTIDGAGSIGDSFPGFETLLASMRERSQRS
jgi:3-phosphoshikimate 1-carboxyvinyltransferase